MKKDDSLLWNKLFLLSKDVKDLTEQVNQIKEDLNHVEELLTEYIKRGERYY